MTSRDEQIKEFVRKMREKCTSEEREGEDDEGDWRDMLVALDYVEALALLQDPPC